TLPRLAPLLLVLRLALAATSAHAEGTSMSVAGAGGLVDAVRDTKHAAIRSFGVYATVGSDGRPRGTISFVDRNAGLRLRAVAIDQLSVADGVATVIGSARIGGDDGYRFRLV